MENVSDYLFISKSRKSAKYFINGEYFSAKGALRKFPQLIGILQPSGKIKQKSLEDKFRRWFVKGKFSEKSFNVEAPRFLETNSALNETFREYLCDDPILNNYDVPSLFALLDENLKKTLRENVKARMRKTSDAKEAIHTFYSGEFEVLQARTSTKLFLKCAKPFQNACQKWKQQLDLAGCFSKF